MKTGMFLIVCTLMISFAISWSKNDPSFYLKKYDFVLKEKTIEEESKITSNKITPYVFAEEIDTPDVAIGTILQDLEDSTILNFLYGSYYDANGKLIYNIGVQIWDEEDSIYMQVEERLGNDTLQIIYVRGEMAYTSVMHNFYNEAALIVRKVEKGWEVINGYKDAQVIDFHSVELAGIYLDRFLLKYEIFGVYGGGLVYGSVEFTLLEPGKFEGSTVNFMRSSSNILSERCFTDPDVEDYHCDCYDRSGKDTFYMDTELNCLIFDYEYTNQTGDCEMKDSTIITAKQKWYMNTNASFLAKGNHLSEWSDKILEEVNLSQKEIKQKLTKK